MAPTLNDLLSPALVSTETLADLRDEFRVAFHEYLEEGDRMAELLRNATEHVTPERGIKIRQQQTRLNGALARYERARQSYVEAVMGQLAGLSAMGLKLQ